MSKRGMNCTGCCGGCGRHFTSQTAFDEHRQRKVEGGKSTWHCVDPSVIGSLERATENGTCRIPPHQDEPLTDVVVWKVAGSSERFAEVFGEAA